MGNRTLSKSSMGMFATCPRGYYYAYIAGTSKKVDYPRLMGSEVHRFIAHLYAKHKDPSRPFFYRDIKTAHNAWFGTWNRALIANKGRINFPDEEKAQQYGATGWICIRNYWNTSVDRAKPVHIEKRYTVPITRGRRFVGIFDQVRLAPLESVRKYRPELISNGQLIDGYDPFFLVDLKTNRYSYDMTVFKPDATPLELAAYQFSLHEDLQVTAYYWLYWQVFHRLPAGFFWWHLRSGKLFYTYRTASDFNTFLEQVEFMLDGLDSGSFPKSVGSHCGFCDHFEVCAMARVDRPLMVTNGAVSLDEGPFAATVEGDVEIVRSKQLRLKLKVPRRKREPIADDPKPKQGKIIVLPNEDN